MGRKMRNEVPWPGSLSISMKPPVCRTMSLTVASPRPVPRFTPFVVKNGSKTRAAVSSSIPMPVSVTERTTASPRA